MDLVELNKAYFEKKILKAIESNDKHTISECLRNIIANSGETVITSRELIQNIADYIDPKIKKPKYKDGPKPQQKSKRHEQAVGLYEILISPNPQTGKRDYAHFFFNCDKSEFSIKANTDPWNEEGDFDPQWNYPDMVRRRASEPEPTLKKIKEYVCRYFDISQSSFDHERAKRKHKFSKIIKKL